MTADITSVIQDTYGAVASSTLLNGYDGVRAVLAIPQKNSHRFLPKRTWVCLAEIQRQRQILTPEKSLWT